MLVPTHLRIIGNSVLAVYLFINVTVFLRTVFLLPTPLPFPVFRYAFGMMAPYQGYDEVNTDVLAEGRTKKGEWQQIDLHQYYPVIFGEMSARQLFTLVKRDRMTDAEEESRRRRFVEQLALLEEADGRTYERIRLTWQQWPTSPGGYYFLYQPEFIENTLLGEWNTNLQEHTYDVFSTQYE